jgi:AraC family transcriptional regulator of adaptative response/methylated-DNA-[protein]-cysteine methyltransferase
MATNAILSKEPAIESAGESTMKSTPAKPSTPKLGSPTPGEARRWQAVLDRDSVHDGTFVFGVSSTGIFCRPSCPARRPRRENVRFFDHATAAEQAGYRACLRCRPKAADANPQSALVRAMCRYIEQHIEDRLSLSLLAGEFRRSPFHLQRTFKSVLGVTPKAYIDACRLRQVKQNLQAGHDVTTALYAAGYGSSSRLYERTAAQLGMTPEKYRRHSELRGGTLVALTGWKTNLTRLIDGQDAHPSLPLDIRATAFQRRVWEALQRIPRGETRSYSAVAKKIGMPKATRAVARACATNPVAIAIPCHRVVREDGELGGYRWGIERKEQLLALEKEAGA